MFPSSPLHLVSVLSRAWLPPVADPASRRAAPRHPPGRRPPAWLPPDCWSTDTTGDIQRCRAAHPLRSLNSERHYSVVHRLWKRLPSGSRAIWLKQLIYYIRTLTFLGGDTFVYYYSTSFNERGSRLPGFRHRPSGARVD